MATQLYTQNRLSLGHTHIARVRKRKSIDVIPTCKQAACAIAASAITCARLSDAQRYATCFTALQQTMAAAQYSALRGRQ